MKFEHHFIKYLKQIAVTIRIFLKFEAFYGRPALIPILQVTAKIKNLYFFKKKTIKKIITATVNLTKS